MRARKKRNSALIEELEPRILFSADGLAANDPTEQISSKQDNIVLSSSELAGLGLADPRLQTADGLPAPDQAPEQTATKSKAVEFKDATIPQPVKLSADTLNNTASDETHPEHSKALASVPTSHSITIIASGDTDISANEPTRNHGSQGALLINLAGGSDLGNKRVLVKFDLSAMPAGATITDARLHMEITDYTDVGGAVKLINVHEVTRAWVEGTGIGDSEGVANWDDARSEVEWTNPGGDYKPTPIASVGTNNITPIDWNVTTTVQAWHTGSSNNYGLIIGSPSSSNTTFTFSSREDSSNPPPRLVITYTLPNQAPTASNLNAAETFTEDTPHDLVDIVVSDIDDLTTSVSLQISDPAAGALSTATSGAVTSTYNTASGTWQASGNVSDVNTLLAAVTFTPAPDYSGSFSINTSVSDGIAAPVTGAKNFTGIAVNDAPTALGMDTAETYTEDTALNLQPISISDIDSSSLSATLTLSDATAGSLNTATAGSITSTFNAVTGQWQATGDISDVNTLLAGLTFTPASNYSGSFSINTSVSDGIAAPVSGAKNVSGIAVNDAPTAVGMDTAETYTEDTPLNLQPMTISDVDDSNVNVIVTLSDTSAGSLDTTATAGSATSTFDAVTGQWSASGSITDVNTLLGGLTFTPTADYNSAFELDTLISDGTDSISGSKSFSAVAINDAPTASNLGITENYTEDQVLNLTDINVSDIDSGSIAVSLTLSDPNAGSLSTATVGSISSSFDSLSGVWQVSGAQAEVNSLLAQVAFTPASNYNSDLSIKVSISDGVAPALAGTQTLVATAVNDAPQINNLVGTVSAFNDNLPVLLSPAQTVAVSDPDAPGDYDGGWLQIDGLGFASGDSLGIETSGVLALSAGISDGSVLSVSGLAVGSLSSTSNNSLRINFSADASPAAVNRIANAITFASDAAAPGVRSVEVVFNDGDGTANGGQDSSAIETVSVVVAQSGNGLVQGTEDSVYTFSAADFEFTGFVGTALDYIELASLPASGVLSVNGTPAAVGQQVDRAALNSGALQYTPQADAYTQSAPYPQFTVLANESATEVNILAGQPSSYTLGGANFGDLDAILASSSNFGDGGTVPVSINTIGSSSTIDAAYLNQGAIYFAGDESDSAWTSAELSALDTWVRNGGILIATSDATRSDAVSDYYGLTIGGVASTTWLVSDENSAAINGPFGLVGNNGSPFSSGGLERSYFNSSSLTAGDGIIARDSVTNEPTLVIRQHGEGWILFSGDEGIFRFNTSGGGTISTANDILAANIFAGAIDARTPPQIHTLDIALAGVNDKPEVSNIDTPESYTEDTVLDLQDIIVSDIDNTELTVKFLLSDPAAGSLSVALAGTTQSEFNPVSGTWSASGPIAELNTLLADLQFTPSAEYNSSFILEYSVSDGELPTLTGNKLLSGVAVDDLPVLGKLFTELMPTDEDTATAPTQVSTLVAQLDASDVETEELGLAITGASGDGVWQYTANASSTAWTDFPAGLAADNALILSSSSQIRYIPNGINGEMPELQVKAWDSQSATPSADGSPVLDNGSAAIVSLEQARIVLNVREVNDAVAGSVQIDNTSPTQGDTLTASHSLSDADGLSNPVTYQWQRDGLAIDGADQQSYTLVAEDVGAAISVVLSYVDDAGHSESLSSTATAAVIASNSPPTLQLGEASIELQENSLLDEPLALTDISIVDDGQGINQLSLGGADADLFEIRNGTLYLKQGVELDYESATRLEVQVLVDDTDVGTSPDDSRTFTVNILDVDENDESGEIDGALIAIETANQKSTGSGVDKTVEEPADNTDSGSESETVTSTEAEESDDSSSSEVTQTGSEAAQERGLPGATRGIEAPAHSSQIAAEVDAVSLDSIAVRIFLGTQSAASAAQGVHVELEQLLALDQEMALNNPLSEIGDLITSDTSDALAMLDSESFREGLDQLRRNMLGVDFEDKIVVGSTVTVSTGVSIGYVLWLIRGSVLLSTLLSSLPAWRLIDPLPVLGGVLSAEDEDDESLESIIEDQQKDDNSPDAD